MKNSVKRQKMLSAGGYKVPLCKPCEEKAEQFAEKHDSQV